MKIKGLLLSIFLSVIWSTTVSATTLIEVYCDALKHDQIFQQAIYQNLVDREGVPISMSALLPALYGQVNPFVSKFNGSGSASSGDGTIRGYDIPLTLTQTIFDFGQLARVWIAQAISKQSDATLNSALQDLMIRVAKAYFAILNDEDDLRYNIAAKASYAKQLEQIQQQYDVGLKTITDVYTAQASYESSQSTYVAALKKLADDKENLRVITGILYPHLAKLSKTFPLLTPHPKDVEKWVATAQCQNWSIIAARYAATAARQRIKEQFAGNLPTLQLQATYDVNFQRIISPGVDLTQLQQGGTFGTFAGSNQVSTTTGALILNVPLIQGGYVISTTRRAQFEYRVSMSKLEQQILNTINLTRQSYTGVMAGISKIYSDEKAVKASMSSLEGMRAAYDVGTGTLFDVLDQQQKLFLAQTRYANDRYNYVNFLLSLKFAAGTLSCQDLDAISHWLVDKIEDTDTIQEYGQMNDCDLDDPLCAKKHHEKHFTLNSNNQPKKTMVVEKLFANRQLKIKSNKQSIA